MPETRARVRRSGLGPARADVLGCLRKAGRALPAADIAAAVELHSNTVRFHLDALVRDGLVVREYEKREQPGRPKTLYRADRDHEEVSVSAYRGLARALVRNLSELAEDAGDAAEAAGYAWGEELAAARAERPGLDRVMEVVAEFGYRPTLVGDPARAIELRPCPFAELLPETGELVCRLHLGLMRGLVADEDGSIVTGLEPWATPTTCLARLGRFPATSPAEPSAPHLPGAAEEALT